MKRGIEFRAYVTLAVVIGGMAWATSTMPTATLTMPPPSKPDSSSPQQVTTREPGLSDEQLKRYGWNRGSGFFDPYEDPPLVRANGGPKIVMRSPVATEPSVVTEAVDVDDYTLDPIQPSVFEILPRKTKPKNVAVPEKK